MLLRNRQIQGQIPDMERTMVSLGSAFSYNSNGSQFPETIKHRLQLEAGLFTRVSTSVAPFIDDKGMSFDPELSVVFEDITFSERYGISKNKDKKEKNEEEDESEFTYTPKNPKVCEHITIDGKALDRNLGIDSFESLNKDELEELEEMRLQRDMKGPQSKVFDDPKVNRSTINRSREQNQRQEIMEMKHTNVELNFFEKSILKSLESKTHKIKFFARDGSGNRRRISFQQYQKFVEAKKNVDRNNLFGSITNTNYNGVAMYTTPILSISSTSNSVKFNWVSAVKDTLAKLTDPNNQTLDTLNKMTATGGKRGGAIDLISAVCMSFSQIIKQDALVPPILPIVKPRCVAG